MNPARDAHRIDATFQQDGVLTLDHLPFRAGQTVEVIILPYADLGENGNAYPLRGTIFHFERPTDPVAEDDWEAMQ